MKAYTDIEQSKKLAEFLPIESSDMLHCLSFDKDLLSTVPKQYSGSFRNQPELTIPCWSLTALLDVLQKTAYFIDEDANVMLDSYKIVEWNLGINNSDLELVTESNPVDACYEMIIKLNEQKLL